MTEVEAQAKQRAYEEHRAMVRLGWFTELEEDWCHRRDIDPRNGRPLFDQPELR